MCVGKKIQEIYEHARMNNWTVFLSTNNNIVIARKLFITKSITVITYETTIFTYSIVFKNTAPMNIHKFYVFTNFSFDQGFYLQLYFFNYVSAECMLIIMVCIQNQIMRVQQSC